MTMRIFCALLRVGLLVACVPPASSDKPFSFVPLPNLSHSFRGDGLVAVLSASVGYFTCCFAGPTALPAAMTLSGNSMSVTEDA